jgi:hypothetical protein
MSRNETENMHGVFPENCAKFQNSLYIKNELWQFKIKKQQLVF